MGVFFIWSAYIAAVGASDLDSIEYIILSISMFFITSFYNKNFKKTVMTSKIAALILLIPSFIMMHIIYTCNWLLWLRPLADSTIILIFFMYIYIFIYILTSN